MIRNRSMHNAKGGDGWQLETLCNMAAAEFLLPTGALGAVSGLHPSVDTILELRKRYEASAEAALLRIQRLTTEQAMAFSCHRANETGRYIVEYALPTGSLEWRLRSGAILPGRTAAECTAIGFTAKRTEHWPHFGDVLVECVGVAPFPHEIYPRVIGFVRPSRPLASRDGSITYLRGDATQTRGTNRRLLLQVVNDSAFTWGGGGFAVAIKKRWPTAQKAFTTQVTADRAKLRLGSVVTSELEDNLTLANLVSQHGYGPSPRPRIRYGALRDCLLRVAELAEERNASVHMPRIGTGLSGGSWPVVEEIVIETLARKHITVTVYDLPQGKEKPKAQADLAFTT
jgi:O-acetyl-ADP-ribose deacetylase (regulator of RNase III)